MDWFCNTSPCALKDINTIYPKTYEILGNLILEQVTTYQHHLHNHLS